MQHDGNLSEGKGVARHIRSDEAEPPLAPQRGEVALLHGTRVEGIEVLAPDHFAPPPDQRLAHVGADEPRGPGDQDPQAHLQTSVRKYSMVRCSPSSSGTRGSQPRVARARAMSGWRTLGSSTGSGHSTIRLLLPVSASTRSASSRTVNSSGFPRFVGSDSELSNNRTMPSIRSSTKQNERV